MKYLVIYFFALSSFFTACNFSEQEQGVNIVKYIPCKQLNSSIYPKITPEAELLYRQALELSQPKGVPIQYKKIQELYSKATQLGHWKARHNLANMYITGDGIERNEILGVQLHKENMQLDIPEGILSYALVLEEERANLQADNNTIVNYYIKAAELGHPRAQTVYAKYLLHLPNVRKYEKQARELLHCAVSQGYSEAAYELAVDYKVYKEYEKALAMYRKGAELGHLTCLYALEKVYNLGWIGLKKDEKKSKCLWDLIQLRKVNSEIQMPADLNQHCPSTVKQPYGG